MMFVILAWEKEDIHTILDGVFEHVQVEASSDQTRQKET